MICDPKSFQHITQLPPKNFNNRIKYQIYNQSAKNKQHKSNIYYITWQTQKHFWVVEQAWLWQYTYFNYLPFFKFLLLNITLTTCTCTGYIQLHEKEAFIYLLQFKAFAVLMAKSSLLSNSCCLSGRAANPTSPFFKSPISINEKKNQFTCIMVIYITLILQKYFI